MTGKMCKLHDLYDGCIRHTVNLIRNTFAEWRARGDTKKLAGFRMMNASRLNGGW
jgi:hypothetical protein